MREAGLTIAAFVTTFVQQFARNAASLHTVAPRPYYCCNIFLLFLGDDHVLVIALNMGADVNVTGLLP